MDRHDLHGAPLALEPLHIALDIDRPPRLGDQAGELLHELAQGDVCTASAVEQELEYVQIVRELALTLGEEDLPPHDARVTHDALEEAIEVAGVRQCLPLVQALDQGVGCGQVARPLDRHEGQAEERREPSREAACAIVRVADCGQ